MPRPQHAASDCLHPKPPPSCSNQPTPNHLTLSTQAKAIPRSQDLTDQSLEDEEPLLGGEALKISSTSTSSSKASSMPGLARTKQQGQVQGQTQGQGLVQEVQLRGAKRTQELIRQNQKLPEADKAAVAETERAKGNEFFRCVQGVCCAVLHCASTTCTVARCTQQTPRSEVTGCRGVSCCPSHRGLHPW